MREERRCLLEQRPVVRKGGRDVLRIDRDVCGS
jgi:hypothetical protein